MSEKIKNLPLEQMELLARYARRLPRPAYRPRTETERLGMEALREMDEIREELRAEMAAEDN